MGDGCDEALLIMRDKARALKTSFSSVIVSSTFNCSFSTELGSSLMILSATNTAGGTGSKAGSSSQIRFLTCFFTLVVGMTVERWFVRKEMISETASRYLLGRIGRRANVQAAPLANTHVMSRSSTYPAIRTLLIKMRYMGTQTTNAYFGKEGATVSAQAKLGPCKPIRAKRTGGLGRFGHVYLAAPHRITHLWLATTF